MSKKKEKKKLMVKLIVLLLVGAMIVTAIFIMGGGFGLLAEDPNASIQAVQSIPSSWTNSQTATILVTLKTTGASGYLYARVIDRDAGSPANNAGWAKAFPT